QKIISGGRSRMKAIVVGAGFVGTQLADRLDNATLIEADPAKYIILKRENAALQIIGGDANQAEVLQRAGIENCSALVIVTNKDYVNWKIALTAREFSVPKVIARLRDESYRQKFKDAGVTHIISPTEETITAILGEVFPTLETVTDILITKVSPALDKRISEIHLSSNSIIAAVRRGEKLLKPNSGMLLQEGDALSLISLGELDVDVYETIAGGTSPYIPRSKMIFLLLSQGDSKALKEVAYLCTRFKVSCEIVIRQGETSLIHMASSIMAKAEVSFSFQEMSGDILAGFRDYVRNLGANSGILVAVHQERKGMFGHELPMKFIKSLIISSPTSILIARGNRYERVLHLLDSSLIGGSCTRCSVSMAMDTSAKLYALCPHSSGSAEHDIVRTHTRRLSRIYGVDVIEDIVTGDPTIEFIQKVRAKSDQLVVINWNSPLIMRDILTRIINDAEASVLIVGGQEKL
ncbi:MAG: TrkA family potassium uptake protein, partial [Thermoplasmata archaeon]|nr:TrkA family potassium uptake protein [Thermoplasmata archaeon]